MKSAKPKRIINSINIKKPLVSIVIPAYNEAVIIEKNLSTLCEYMKSIETQYDWELIVVNDGSTDETGNLAEHFAKDKDNVHVLHHMFNFRLGQALRYAFSRCKGDYVVVMDVDLSYSPDHIGKMLARIKEARAKIVIASPYMRGGKVSNVPWLRKTLSIWANRFLALIVTRDLFSDRLTTLTGMVRAYDGKFLHRLNLKAMDFDIMPEIVYKAMILRARIVEIPAHLKWSAEKSKKTETIQRKSSIRIIRNIVQCFLSGFNFRPFIFFILPGFALMMLSIYPIAWALIHSFRYYHNFSVSDMSFAYRFSDAIAAAFRQSPHSFIIGGFSLMISIQLISLGLLALQQKRYFEELFHLKSSMHMNNKPNDNSSDEILN